MASCVCCGSYIPENQGSNTCSMCYGDPGHGKDGYYQKWLDNQAEIDALKQQEMEEFNKLQEKKDENRKD